MFDALISTSELESRLEDENWAIFDSRFYLTNPSRGREEYGISHLPRARYVHLDEDLSGAILPGDTGRHPLPPPEVFGQRLSNWEIDERVQVVVYDNLGGAIAARMWWMLRWLGHNKVAVLDGGWQKWLKENRPVTGEIKLRPPRQFKYEVQETMVVDVIFVDRIKADPQYLLVDSRDGARYRGDEEPIDPVAGHIPGAVSAPYQENLTPAGVFKPVDQLTERFDELLKNHDSGQTVFYCGSGVTSAHNILALKLVGYGEPKLYAGSWSEWITDGGRLREVGSGDEVQQLAVCEDKEI